MRYDVCSRCNAVLPSGKFSCPSCDTLLGPGKRVPVKLCRHDGTPIPVSRHFCTTCGARISDWYVPWWSWLCVVALLSIGVTILLTNMHHALYKTYRQNLCLITHVGLFSWSDKNGTYYQPDFGYQVMQSNGGQVLASDDDSLGLSSSSSQDYAQQQADQYQVHSTYPCWHSPIASPNTLLMQPDEANSGSPEALVWLFGSAGLLALVSWCIMYFFIYPWGLRKRTVEIAGTVVEHQQRQSRNTTYTVSIVEYETQTDPPLKCRKVRSRDIPLRSQVKLCYDWLNPAKNARFRPTYPRSVMVTDMICGASLTLFLLAGGSAFMIWLAFRF